MSDRDDAADPDDAEAPDSDDQRATDEAGGADGGTPDTATGGPIRETPGQWDLLDRQTEYETGWYTGGYDRLEQPDGSEKNYYWAELPDAVVIVARTGDEIVLVDQYRPVIREQCLELPAGIVEDGESYTTAGARELREETGFDPAGVSLIEEFWCSTGVLRHRRGIVFAEGLEPVERKLDGNEFLSVTTVPIDDALDVARREPANDATIEGILLAKEEGLL